jgi:hypothetical protein
MYAVKIFSAMPKAESFLDDYRSLYPDPEERQGEGGKNRAIARKFSNRMLGHTPG